MVEAQPGEQPFPRTDSPRPPGPSYGACIPDPQYVDAFRAVAPRAAGYTYHRADPTHFDGYYQTTQHHYDVQDDPTGGRGLLVWQDDALGIARPSQYDRHTRCCPCRSPTPPAVRSASYDYRVLKPSLVTDANGNQTAVSYSPLGLPAAIAAMGKPGEQVGDTIDHPGTWFTYDLRAYDNNPGDRAARSRCNDQARRPRLDTDQREGPDARPTSDRRRDRCPPTARRAGHQPRDGSCSGSTTPTALGAYCRAEAKPIS